MIGKCVRCAKCISLDETFAECSDRGPVNVTFARNYHDCFVPRSEVERP